MVESPAGGIDGHRAADGVTAERKEAHDPATIYPPLSRPWLDRTVLRHGAVDRRSRPCLDPQPGGLSAPRRSGQSVATHDLYQSTASQRRRRRSQLDSTL